MKRSFLIILFLSTCNLCFLKAQNADSVVAYISESIFSNNICEADTYFNEHKQVLDSSTQNLLYSIISIAKYREKLPFEKEKTISAILSCVKDFSDYKDVLKDNPQGFMPFLSSYVSFLSRINDNHTPQVFAFFREIWPTVDEMCLGLYVQALEDYAVFQYSKNDYTNAISSFEELLQLSKTDRGLNTPPYLIRYLTGRCYLYTGNDLIAQNYFDEACNSIGKNEIDNNIQSYYNLLRDRFEIAIKHKQYSKAKELGIKLIQYYKSIDSVQDNINVSIELSRLELAAFNDKSGIALYEDGMKLILSSQNYDDASKKLFLEDLYTIYNTFEIKESNRKFQKEVKLYGVKTDQTIGTSTLDDEYILTLEKTIKEQEQYLTDVPNYVHSTSYISQYYANRKQEQIGIDAAMKAISLCRANHVPEIEYASLYNVLGSIYQTNLSNYNQAKDYFSKAIELYSMYEASNSDYIVTLCNAARNYKNLGDLLSAKIYIDEAYKISTDNKNIKSDKTTYYDLFQNLSWIYAALGDEDKSLEFNSRIIDDIDNSENIDTFEKNVFLLSRAQILLQFNRYDKAAAVLSSINRNYLEEYTDGWITYEAKYFANDANCVQDLHKISNHDKEAIKRLYSTVSDASISNQWYTLAGNLNFAFGMALSKFYSPEIAELSYNNLLFTKTFQLEFQKSNRESGNINTNIEKIFIEAANTEQISKNLGKTDFAVEFCTVYDRQSYSEVKKKYAALILASGSKQPWYIEICNCEDLDNIVYQNTIIESIDYANKYYDLENNEIYKLIWEPMEKYIPLGSNVYISNVGATWNINFMALSDGEHRLSEFYQIHNVLSTAYISSCKNVECSISSALLYGDIDYNVPIKMMANESNKYKASLNSKNDFALYRGIDERGSWKELQHSAEEIKSIAEILLEHGVDTHKLTREHASEESFKSLNGKSPNLLHISTHGFYYQPGIHSFRTDYTNSYFGAEVSNSMQYNGLLLSGANNAWKDNIKEDGVEDGVLTAEEISNLNLSNTKLVTLSACQTALGDISDIDGNNGLIKSFHLAGVKNTLTALWSVSDAATSILMEAFYKYLSTEKDPYSSLNKAQEEVQQSMPDPYYWAGFILTE